MEKGICRYYDQNIDVIYNTYIRAIHTKFNKNCTSLPYYKLEFKLDFSFYYNINGGNCCVLFMPYRSGTAVYVQYDIKQAFGARYKAHEMDMTSFVENQLNLVSQQIEIAMNDFIRNKDLSICSSTPSTSSLTISPADELKKYKELLDMGAITQEEFELKKKQLLGL